MNDLAADRASLFNRWLVLVPLIAFLSQATAQVPNELVTLSVNIQNIRESRGAIQCALYNDPATFLQDEGVLAGKVIPVTTTKTIQWMFTDLPPGRYVAAVFHDLNNNGKLDKNLLGIPKEPYAFAVKEPSKWRDPTFEEIAFTMNDTDKKITLSLAYWKER